MFPTNLRHEDGQLPHHLRLHLNARLQPAHRHELEVALGDTLLTRAPGWTVDGGGTLLSKVGEPLSCDIELEAEDASAKGMIWLATTFLLRFTRRVTPTS
jgi:hypothetical protein